jgi:hypothetical protein
MTQEPDRPLTEEEADFVLRRALQLQEATGKYRSPQDILASLQELGVDPVNARQALEELHARPAAPPEEAPAPGRRERLRAAAWRLARRGVALAMVVTAVASFAAWQAEIDSARSAREDVRATMQQLMERQEYYHSRNGEYAGTLEELGKLAERNRNRTIELLGGGKDYYAHIAHDWSGAWCQVRVEEGAEPRSECR